METSVGLLAALLLTGVRCGKDAVFVYGRLGGDALLPCPAPDSSACASVSWTFYRGSQVRFTEEVSGGRVRADSDRAGRLSLASDCSLGLRALRAEDAGSYVCLRRGEAVGDVYLSLLAVESPSGVAELRPGGRLALSCVLHTFYDAGSCNSYSSGIFELSWRSEDGGALNHSRYQLSRESRCSVTLVTTLQADDGGRRWRCQVNATDGGGAAFIDLRPAFLFGHADAAAAPGAPEAGECPAPPPVCRAVLCVALPLMVVAVGLFTWRLDLKRAKHHVVGAQTRTSLQRSGV